MKSLTATEMLQFANRPTLTVAVVAYEFYVYVENGAILPSHERLNTEFFSVMLLL
jgi:hypothetical protein